MCCKRVDVSRAKDRDFQRPTMYQTAAAFLLQLLIEG